MSEASLRTPLRPSRVRERLGSGRFARDLRVLGIVSSTSDLVMARARSGEEDGLVIAAEGQTRGRGRRGRSWHSPSGKGLWFSVLLKPPPPPEHRGLLSAIAALAMVRGIEELELRAAVKWPNDVIVGGRKVGGALVELGDDAGRPFAVIGIGINANLGREDLPADAPVPAGSLRAFIGRPVDRERLLAGVLKALEEILDAVGRDGAAALHAELRERDALRGAWAVLREGDRVVEGTVLAAHPTDGILVRDEGGREHRLRPEHAEVLRVRLA